MQVHGYLIPESKPLKIEGVVVLVVPTLFWPVRHLLLRWYRCGSPRQGKGLTREAMLAYSASQDLAHSSFKICTDDKGTSNFPDVVTTTSDDARVRHLHT